MYMHSIEVLDRCVYDIILYNTLFKLIKHIHINLQFNKKKNIHSKFIKNKK
jgi:hypothetical protein